VNPDAVITITDSDLLAVNTDHVFAERPAAEGESGQTRLPCGLLPFQTAHYAPSEQITDSF
jgi:hypothetical protein